MKDRHIAETDFSQLIEGKDSKQMEADIIDFIISLKERGYALASQQVYLNALIHFYSINDVMLRRKKISKFLSNDDIVTENYYDSNNDSSSSNKPYTNEQIAKLLNFADIRTKVMVLIMSSAGLRLGALPLLRVGDLTPIPEHDVYQIRVYANSKINRHYTFCTPECRKAIDNYLDYRRSCGENITPKSPLFRREFGKRDVFQVANDVKTITVSSIKRSLNEVLYASGLRTPLIITESKKTKDKVFNTRRQLWLMDFVSSLKLYASIVV
jgi:site-specific recombinase XerC